MFKSVRNGISFFCTITIDERRRAKWTCRRVGGDLTTAPKQWGGTTTFSVTDTADMVVQIGILLGTLLPSTSDDIKLPAIPFDFSMLYLSEIVASFLQRTTSCEATLHRSNTEQSYNIIHGWDGVTISAARGGAISLRCKSGALAVIPTHTVIDTKTGVVYFKRGEGAHILRKLVAAAEAITGNSEKR